MPEAWATLLRLAPNSDEYGRWLDRMAEASPAILDDISDLRDWLSDDGDLRGMLDRLQNDFLPLEMAKIAFDLPDDVDAREMQDKAVKMLALLVRARLAGVGLDNIFKCTVMLRDMTQWSAFNSVYLEFFKKDRLPARTSFGVNSLVKNALVEIDCMAVAAKTSP